jgi:hypothetical protein
VRFYRNSVILVHGYNFDPSSRSMLDTSAQREFK